MAESRRTTTLRFAIFKLPLANERATTAGKASGKILIIKATQNSKKP